MDKLFYTKKGHSKCLGVTVKGFSDASSKSAPRNFLVNNGRYYEGDPSYVEIFQYFDF